MDDPQQQPAGRRPGTIMTALAWIIGLALLTWLFSGQLDSQRNPNRDATAEHDASGAVRVVLTRNRNGHYVALGSINSIPAPMMLDTGASDVVVPGALAARMGLKRGPAARYQTANGLITGYRTRIDRLSIAGLELHDVAASINPSDQGQQVLVGMSALRQVNFSQRGNTLELLLTP